MGKPRVYIKGVSPLTAGVILQFLYTGTTRLDRTNTIDVLLASERLGLTVLSKLAERHLPAIINEENVCTILMIGNNNRLTGLTAIATSYALRHFDGIMDTALSTGHTNGGKSTDASLSTSAAKSTTNGSFSNGFLQLPRAVLASLLAHSDLCVLSEEKLLHGILRWGIANLPTGIMKDIPVTKKYNSSASASYLSTNNETSSQSYAKQSNSIASAAGYLNSNSTLPSHLSTINNGSNNGLLVTSSSIDIIDSTSANLPAVPMTAIPGLKTLLLELFSTLRWASMDLQILKSPIVSAIVAPELILQAMFEKMGGNTKSTENIHDSHYGIGITVSNNDNVYSSYDSFGTSGFLTMRNNSTNNYSSLIHSNGNNGLLSRSSLLPSLDLYNSHNSTSSTGSLYDNNGGSNSHYYENSRISRDSAVSAYVGNSTGGYDRPQTPVRPSNASNGLFSPNSSSSSVSSSSSNIIRPGGGLSDLFGSSMTPSVYPLSVPLNNGVPSVNNNSSSSYHHLNANSVKNNLTSPRRYGKMDSSSALTTTMNHQTLTGPLTTIPKYLRFDAYISGTVSLSNANRSISFNNISEFIKNHRHVNLSSKQQKQQQLTEDILAAEGSRGGILASVLPGITVSKFPGETLTNNQLLSSGLYSYDVVIEDSDSLLFVDPEKYASSSSSNPSSTVGTSTTTGTITNMNMFSNGGIIPVTNTLSNENKSTLSNATAHSNDFLIRPFEVALCLLPVGSATTALTNGIQSGDPTAYGAVWFATNRGDVYGLSAPATESSTVTWATETTENPSTVPSNSKLERIATGIPFGISSYITVSVDGTSGDIGMSIATSRCGFDKDDDDNDDEPSLDYSNDNENTWEEKEQKLSGNSNNNNNSSVYVTGESSGAPRPPPSPFVLLPRSNNVLTTNDTSTSSSSSAGSTSSSSVNIPSYTLHCPDPSAGTLARIHAVTSKLNLHNIPSVTSQGLQFAILARVSKGLKITLVPTLKIS